jgi:Cytochrome c554 and c-prime
VHVVRLSLVIAFVLSLVSSAKAQVSVGVRKGKTTEQHLTEAGWWPRKGGATPSDYVGSKVCGQCHSELLATQQRHAMAHTSMPAFEAEGTQQKASLSIGPFRYTIAPLLKSVNYTVSDGHRSVTVPLLWGFGSGGHGQTFLFSSRGSWYETRISFFRGSGLGITPGESSEPGTNLYDALGREVPDQEAKSCFGCHATAALTNDSFNPAGASSGITCEACHGPGVSHVAMARIDPGDPGMILNPEFMTPEDSVDFCGSCHRTAWDVLEIGAQGTQTARFPAYRLEQSQCWGNGDPRITCVACHNPHKPLVTSPSAYDSKCLNCHVRSRSLSTTPDHPARGCSVASERCVQCHMPKYTLPQMHASFTDHDIRIVRDPDDFPEH